MGILFNILKPLTAFYKVKPFLIQHQLTFFPHIPTKLPFFLNIRINKLKYIQIFLMHGDISAEEDYNHLYKSISPNSVLFNPLIVVLVGDAGVGKTHLLNRYEKVTIYMKF